MTDLFRDQNSDCANSKLSDKAHWDKVVGGIKLPRIYSREQFNIRRFDRLLSNVLSISAKTLFEVGCGSSAWLPYFKNYYGFTVAGLDYSELGCEIAKRNLEYFDRKFGEDIYCADVTALNGHEFGRYDVVFSYGLIEHFDDPATIVKEMKQLVAENGQIVTVVPNLHGFYGVVSRLLLPKIYAMHKIIDPTQLERTHLQSGFRTEYCGYYGTFYLHVIPWVNTERGFMKVSIIKRTFMKTIDLLGRVSEWLLDWFNVSHESAAWSPYVVYIGRRSE